MTISTEESREATLRRTGGSRSLVLPKPWLDEMNVTDRVRMRRVIGGIMIEAPTEEVDLESRPEFARFLEFLTTAALTHPERLGNVADLTAGDDELFAGVEIDD